MNDRLPADPVPVVNESGIAIQPLYTEADVAASGGAAMLGRPGEYPFTRGIHPLMYRKQPWTMRQYTGFGDAADTNARFKYLIATGQTGLNVAFDLPTQCGLDSDDPQRCIPRVDLAPASGEKCREVRQHVAADQREHRVRLVEGLRDSQLCAPLYA